MKTYLKAYVFAGLVAAAAAAALAAEVVPVLPADYTSVQLRDPFESYVVKEEAPITPAQLQEEMVNPPQLSVQGITWGSSFPQAIVNNKVLRQGDQIEGAEIVQIKSNAIIFRFKNREFTLASPAAGTAARGESGLQ